MTDVEEGDSTTELCVCGGVKGHRGRHRGTKSSLHTPGQERASSFAVVLADLRVKRQHLDTVIQLMDELIRDGILQ